MNIKNFFKSKNFNIEIPQSFRFLQKYDKNHNSIFEEDEINELKTDLYFFAQKDDKKNDLSEQEALEFFNNAVNNMEIQDSVKNNGSKIVQKFIQYFMNQDDIFNQLENNLDYQNCSDLRKKCIKELLLSLNLTAIDFNDKKDIQYSIENCIAKLDFHKISEERLPEVLDIIMNTQRTFEQISDNPLKCISSFNGNSYIIEVSKNNLYISDSKENLVKQFDLSNIIKNNLSNNINPIDIVKQIPINQLLLLDNLKTLSFESLSPRPYYRPEFQKIEVCEPLVKEGVVLDKNTATKEMFSMLMHEFGHLLDDMGNIKINSELNEVFLKELDAFTKFSTKITQKHIEYYMENIGKTESPAGERVAQANFLLTTNSYYANEYSDPIYQEFFPETIAKIAELLDKTSNI